MKRSRKLLCLLLAAAMCVSLLPATAAAAGDTTAPAEAAEYLRSGEYTGAAALLRRLVGLYDGAQSAQDYPDNIVLDFGETGFGVLKQDVIEIPGTATERESGAFTFPAAKSLRTGDIILLTLDSGVRTPVKVKTASLNGDGTMTVVPDEEVSISEMYEAFRLDAAVDVGAAAQNDGLAPALDGGEIDLMKLSSSVTLADSLTVEAEGTVKLCVSALYDKRLFGEDYIEFSSWLETDTQLSVTVSGEIGSEDMTDAFGNPTAPELLLYEGPIAVVGPGLIWSQVKVSVPLEFAFKASGSMTLQMTSREGWRFDSDNGVQRISDSSEPTCSFEIKGGFEVKAGPKAELSVTAMYALSGSISGQAGIKASAKLAAADDNSTAAPSRHACRECADISISLFARIGGSLKYNLGVVKGTIASIEPLSQEWFLTGAYYSIVNDPESRFGGAPAFGFGQCPNRAYRITVNTVDAEGEPVSGIPVTVASAKSARSGASPFTDYFYAGKHTASAAFDSGDVQAELTVSVGAMTVTLQEEPPVTPSPAPTPTATPAPTPTPTAAPTPTPEPTPASSVPEELRNAQPGDMVTFGQYEQNGSSADGPEPIRWRVLDRQNGRLLVISEYGLANERYHEHDCEQMTWEQCTLRTWMNGEFLYAAFSPEERELIPAVTVSAGRNPQYDTDPGGDTTDRVFLLSIAEAERYFPTAESRLCLPAASLAGTSIMTNKSGYCWWWLRSPGNYPVFAVYVSYNGSINYYGHGVRSNADVVRPALWIEVA